MASPKSKPPPSKGASKDDFASVAKALGCDDDKARFEAKLGKIAKASKGKPVT